MSIPSNQLSPAFTGAIAQIYNDFDSISVKPFLKSKFPSILSPVRYPVIEVMRGTEKVAIPVPRGHQGNIHTFDKFSQKAVDPFYMNDGIVITEMELYNRVFGSRSFATNDLVDLAMGTAKKMMQVKMMQERKYEIMRMQCLLDGKIYAEDGTTVLVDYGRKAGSLVDLGAGSYWNEASTDPYLDIEAAGIFLRTTGKAATNMLDVIFSVDAWNAFQTNDTYKERAKYFNFNTDMIDPTMLNTEGAIYKGQADCGAYRARFWVYDNYYENASGTMMPIMEQNKVIVLPTTHTFNMIFGAVPTIVSSLNTIGLKVAEYDYYDFIDVPRFMHEYHVHSAGIPVLTSVDKVYTIQCLAS